MADWATGFARVSVRATALTRSPRRMERLTAICGASVLLGGAVPSGPIPAPELFAPGIVSGAAGDGAPTFSPDGRTLLFDRTNSHWTVILEARRHGVAWSTPVLASFSGLHTDQQPSFSPDGRYLVFVSSRFAKDGRGGESHIYRVKQTPGGWSEPIELPPEVYISKRIFKPSVAANGDIYFMSDGGTEGPPKWRLYRARARRDGEGFATAEPLAFSGAEDDDVDPYVAPDQSFLIFSSSPITGGSPAYPLDVSARSAGNRAAPSSSGIAGPFAK